MGARPAPEELLAAAGPEYAAEDVRDLLGERGPGLANLWLAWEAVRPALLAEDRPLARRADASSFALQVSTRQQINAISRSNELARLSDVAWQAHMTNLRTSAQTVVI